MPTLTQEKWRVGEESEYHKQFYLPIVGKLSSPLEHMDDVVAWCINGSDTANLIASAPELLDVCKQLIMHKNQNNLHPIDYQRIEQAIKKAEGGNV